MTNTFNILSIFFVPLLGFCQTHGVINLKKENYSIVDSIVIQNNSFEDYKGEYAFDQIINSWFDCGKINSPQYTPPGIHTNRQPKVNEVLHNAEVGQTYISLVTRSDDSWESLTQKLQQNLLKDHTYYFSMRVSTSPSLKGLTIDNKEELQTFNAPTRIVLWGGHGLCSTTQLLIETDPIDSDTWHTLEFIFQPEEDIEHLTIEAYYEYEDEATFGNVLIDKVSHIYEVKKN